MEYRFKVELTQEEYVEFALYSTWSAPWMRKTRLKNYAVLIYSFFFIFLGTLAFIGLFDKNVNYENKSLVLIAIVVFGISLSFTLFSVQNSIRKRANKFFLDEVNKHILDEAEMVFSDEGLQFSTSLVSINCKWQSIVRYAKNDKFLMLFLNSNNALVIPIKLFKTNEEEKIFDEFLTQRISLAASFSAIQTA